MIGANDQDASQFALGTGSRLQADRIHPDNLRQPALQRVHQQQRALSLHRILQGMQQGETGQAGRILIDLRVVLHRAATKRIKALVDGVIHLAQLHIVSHDIQFGHFRQIEIGTKQTGIWQRRFRYIALRQQRRDLAAWCANIINERFKDSALRLDSIHFGFHSCSVYKSANNWRAISI